MQSKKGKLVLVGAGPGDPDLISLKGVKKLSEADVVLYDTLSHPDLLDHAPPEAERIYVGKKPGSCKNSQDEINSLIVEKAYQGHVVVRLKGGDPFIFGRGHEELDYARDHGIPVDVVPGISSCTSVGELQSIPLTKRCVNESFWVTTGVTRNGSVSEDIRMAAQTNATIVILMGMRNLPKIVNIFKSYNRKSLPVAVIQKGSLPEEKIALGTIGTIVEEVNKHGLTNPALILIGEVVKLHPAYHSAQKPRYFVGKRGMYKKVRHRFSEFSEYLKTGITALSY
ncbi:uroporphyrinogen-III C-methyltransferase [Gracilimonas mengyeensis]|uniref:uroporphyrinogen-III C-methyltransferase n=1 Tax=Gracilimonas mengyeensis TaxID=1302730 RepID=A0A521BLH7_9BACT|nr:uroporphyrinogen-III C-methyltransferase [Gracilimonas mengyeensis]SMO47949.1 uroporphyrinogen-III C-methyltransferase [Gracilimonas mengyeensis]